MKNGKLKAVIVGAGEMGQAHSAAWRETDEVDVMAVSDFDTTRAEALSDEWGGQAYGDYREAIDAVDPDIVSVCVPIKFHPEVAVYAAKKSVHVLCEKQIALTLEEADKMIITAADAGTILGIAYQLRHSHTAKELKRVMTEKTIGRPCIYGLRLVDTVRAKLAMHDRNLNGGPFIDMICHWIDMWRHIFDSEVSWVLGRGFTFAKGNPHVDTVHELAIDTGVVIIEFESGDSAQIEMSWGLPSGFKEHRIREDDLVGPLGIVKNLRSTDEILLITEQETRTLGGTKWPDPGPAYGMRAEMARTFVRAVRSGTPPTATGEDAKRCLAVSLAILESMEKSDIVRL